MSKHNRNQPGTPRGTRPVGALAARRARRRSGPRTAGPIRSWRSWLVLAGASTVPILAAAAFMLTSVRPAAGAEITVYKSPTCACCGKWIRHMRDAGFRITEKNLADVVTIKKKYGVPTSLYSCHTSLAGEYVIEGHVPADLVQRLLDEQPAVTGLAVPGMPAGSPGMEGAVKEPYVVRAFARMGEVSTYAVR